MNAPLTALECELLEAVLDARIEDRDHALAVLGDYWIERVDEARGAFLHLHVGDNRERIELADEEARLSQLTRVWRAPLLAAGYRDRDLELVDGFLQWPLVITAGHALDGHPNVVRLSPRYYRELRVVRDGAEHTVYEAEAITPRTKRRVVVKAAVNPGVQRILEREIALLSRFAHPNLPCVVGFAVRPPRFPNETDETTRSLVLAWSGIDLLRLLRSAREANQMLGVAFAIGVAVQLLEAITEIDRAQIVHTEIRPDHVTVAADGTVTLIDFGYAMADLPRPTGLISPGRPMDSYRFRHMAPEQVLGQAIAHRSDVFSAAGVISQLVANVNPAPLGDSSFETLDLVRRTRQVASIELPDAFRVPLQRALALDPTLRPTAAELREDLLVGARRVRMDIGLHVVAERLVELGVPT